jgi:hypothetical protein
MHQEKAFFSPFDCNLLSRKVQINICGMDNYWFFLPGHVVPNFYVLMADENLCSFYVPYRI